jgi:hypothetical protein
MRSTFRQFCHNEDTKMSKEVYWAGNLPPKDDFGIKYDVTMIDGATKYGPWACMTPKSWRVYGMGKLGTGFGQKYVKQADGRWLKVEG